MAFRIQLRRDTKANWAANNPVLLLAEFGYEYDTGKAKIGDGVNPWNDLPYFSGDIVGALKFTDLSDAPSGYTGSGGYFLQVNPGATGIEFSSPNSINLINLGGYATGDAGLYLRVNAGGTGLEWAQASATGGSIKFSANGVTGITSGNAIDLVAGSNVTISLTESPSGTARYVIDSVGGTGSTFEYTNPTPMPEKVGGIEAGTTFANVPLKDLWDSLLYPYQQPSFNAVSVSPTAGGGAYTVVEVGVTLAAAVNFNWTVNNGGSFQTNSVSLYDVTGSTSIATGLATTGSPYSYTYGSGIRKTSKSSHTWRWQALSTQSVSFNKTYTVNWYYPVFSGRSASATLSASDILLLGTRAAKASSSGNYSFSAASPGSYVYICIPDSYNITSMIVNGLPLATADTSPYTNIGPGGLRYATVASVDINGVSTTYRVYRSKYTLSGAVTVEVTG